MRSRDLGRTDRERLRDAGFIQEVMKGWYIITRPDEVPHDTTAWYTSFWGFCSEYLTERFGEAWCLSPDQSLMLHSGNWTVPRQLLVRAPAGSNRITELQHNTSILDVRQPLPAKEDQGVLDAVRVYSIEAALFAVTETFFLNNPVDARAVLSTQRDAAALLTRLLAGGHTVIAGRLAGAFRNIGAGRIADDILGTMRVAGHTVRESDPFNGKLEGFSYSREPSPYVHRIKAMWIKMRADIIGRFPAPAERNVDVATYLTAVDRIYVTDAYHSLSIEGYRVTRELIERVRTGIWNPQQNDADRQQKDAMAARGYFMAFECVKKSLERILRGENPGAVADDDHAVWYREMFGPSVEAGLIPPASLAGYRNWPVYIRGSQHRPLNHDAVRDAMPTLFDLLREERDPAVRVVLGHFIFVYIHPYMDGNGRMGRFLMNVMMAAAGYDWTVVPVERRTEYMQALEAASVRQDIIPFTDFLASLLRNPTAR
ncbi:Fic family protein [Asticcacaulis benevestitus]|uniref:Fic family protein n=1 Tax=Asticcacaulis benevestitus TaxID=347481 RepID=UPI001F394F14|nr:Fic family protein [Asticcacaulis benevestitus]